MNKPKVSIIIPTHNVEKYFRECIESAINQTLKEIEIIPVDNGSPDNCGKIMDEYAAIDARIKPIHQKNKGYGGACNAGLAVANGEYIAILEADDIFEPDMCETLYRRAKKHNLDICKGDFYTYYEVNHKKYYQRMKYIANENAIFTIKENPLIFKFHVSIWSAIYKREYLNKNNIKFIESDGATYQDMPFAAEVYAAGGNIGVVHEPIINYRTFRENSSSKKKDSRLIQMPKMCQIAKKSFETHNCWNEVNEIAYRSFYNCCINFYNQIENNLQEEYLNECYKLFKNIEKEVNLNVYEKNTKNILKLIARNDNRKLRKYIIQSAKKEQFSNKLKYLKYKILQNFTFGKNKQRYIDKKKFYKNLSTGEQ